MTTSPASARSAVATPPASVAEVPTQRPGPVDGVTADPSAIIIDIATVAAHPENPRETLGDLSELGAAISATGLLQPIVVASAAAFVAAQPHHAEAIGDADWVVIAGHRRRAAILEHTKLRQVRATRADHLVNADTDDLIAIAVENIHRLALSPLAEASLYTSMMSRGLTRAEIIERVNKSKGHVSKRLKLLNLVPELKAVLLSGRLRLEDAALYADEDSEVQRAAWAYVDLDKRGGIGPVEALALQKRHAERQERSTQARAQAADMGVEIVDPQGLWGRKAAAHRLVDDGAIAEARAAGTLAAALDETGELYWVTTTAPATLGGSDEDDAAEAERAGKARAEACQRIAARKVAAAEALRRTALALITPVNHTAAGRLAHGWLRTAGVGPDLASAAKYFEVVRTSGDNALIQQVGYAMALAADELQTRDAKTWTAHQADYVRRLTVEAEYRPTAWELRRLTLVDADASPTTEG